MYHTKVDFTLQILVWNGKLFLANIGAVLAKCKYSNVGAVFHANIANIGQGKYF